jgi:hypothetical protein
MVQKKGTAGMSRKTAIRRSRELIAALDRRVPRAGSRGEVGIAAESAALRLEAEARIESLETEAGPDGKQGKGP